MSRSTICRERAGSRIRTLALGAVVGFASVLSGGGARADHDPLIRSNRDFGTPGIARVFFDGVEKFSPRRVILHAADGVYAADLPSEGVVVRHNRFDRDPLRPRLKPTRIVDYMDERHRIGTVYRSGDTLVVIAEQLVVARDRIPMNFVSLTLRKRERVVVEVPALRYVGEAEPTPEAAHLGRRIGVAYDNDPSTNGVAALIAPSRF